MPSVVTEVCPAGKLVRGLRARFFIGDDWTELGDLRVWVQVRD